MILFAVAYTYLAQDKGVIALMLPTSIFRGLHGEGLRRFLRNNILEAWDLEEIKPFERTENQPGVIFVLKR